MIWHILLVMFISGQQIELVGTKEFPSLADCNVELAAFANIQMRGGAFAFTCIHEVRA